MWRSRRFRDTREPIHRRARGFGSTREELQRRQLTANQTNWLVPAPPEPFRCQAQIRYNSKAQDATAEILPSGDLQIDFDQPVEGVAAGQAVVCYQDQRVLGGGWIC